MSYPHDPPAPGTPITFPGALFGSLTRVVKDNSYGKYIVVALKPNGSTEMVGIEFINNVWTAVPAELTVFPDMDGVLKKL